MCWPELDRLCTCFNLSTIQHLTCASFIICTQVLESTRVVRMAMLLQLANSEVLPTAKIPVAPCLARWGCVTVTDRFYFCHTVGWITVMLSSSNLLLILRACMVVISSLSMSICAYIWQVVYGHGVHFGPIQHLFLKHLMANYSKWSREHKRCHCKFVKRVHYKGPYHGSWPELQLQTRVRQNTRRF